MITIFLVSFYSGNAQTNVSSLSELRSAVQNSNQQIIMKPGNYNLEDLPSNSRNINVSGDNNTVILTGVYINVPVGSVSTTYFFVSGDDNTIIDGEFEDTYRNGLTEITDFVAYNLDRENLSFGLRGAAVMDVTGDDNLIDGIKLTVRGSFPYGYGSMYGINQYNTFGLSKRCGLLVTGERNTLDHVEVQQRAFGHAIYMQGDADNTVVKNSLVEGRVRAYAELYEETDPNSFPYRSDYKLPETSNTDYELPLSSNALPIPRDQVFSMAEDGIRSYTGTGSVTVENCTVKKTRGGIRLYLGSGGTVRNSVALDCGSTNFNLPNGGSIASSSGNFSYAPLSDFRLGRSNMDIEWTVIPSPNAIGPHNIADVQGNNHNIVFHRAPGPLDTDEERAIVVTGDNSDIVNETEYTIILASGASGNTVRSCGPVINNGSNNDISQIDCEDVGPPVGCTDYVSNVTPPSNLVSGINYAYYEGTWDNLPNFDALTPEDTGITSAITLDNAASADYFGFTFDGYINVSTDGEYTFYTKSDDGSALWIGNDQVVDNDGLHGSVEKSGTICLEAGYHKIEVAYFEKTGGNSLTVSYAGPGISKTTLSNLYTQGETTTEPGDFPDPNKTYYIDAPYHDLRLAATGESEDAYTTSTNTTGADVEWQFIDKGNGYWHIQRAAGGSTPRLRTDKTENADMQSTAYNKSWTYFDFAPGAITDTYFITLPDVDSDHKRLQIDRDGAVKMVEDTRNGTWESFRITEASAPTATFYRIEAEEYDAMSGIKTENSTESGDNVGWINDEDWLRFDDIDLTGAQSVDLRIASNFAGGTIQIRTGSATGTLIGSVSVSYTGGHQEWETVSTSISNVSGVQDVYLVFTGGSGYLFNINWLEFSADSYENKDTVITTEIIVYPNPVASTTIIKGAKDTMVTIYDMNGRSVLTKNILTDSEELYLSSLIPGIYFAQVKGLKRVSSIKIVKN